jgi:MFS family permease
MTSTSAVLRRLPALQSRDYRRLFISFFFASASRWALVLGQSWLVFDLSDSSFAVGAVFFAGSSQFVIVGPFAGAIADRIDRRRLAIGALVLSLLSSITLAAITLAGVVEVWHVVALAVVQGWAQAAAMPAQRALLANLVPREHLMNAVALGGITVHGSRIAGPLFGGVLLATVGAGSVFLLSVAVLSVALALLTRIEHRSEPADRPTGVTGIVTDVGQGFGHVWGDRRLRLVIGLIIFHCSFTMAFNALLPRLATDLGGGSLTFSAIVMGVGAGAIIGTLAISMVRDRALQGVVLASVGVGSGLAMMVMGLAHSPAIVVVGAVLAGATQATYMAISQMLVQDIVPDALRGRVMAIYTMMAAGHMAMVNLGFGALADRVGVRPLMIVPALLWIGIFLVAAFMLSDLRHVLRRGEFRVRSAPSVEAPGIEASGV